jgi:hypothetical protein
VQEHRSSQFVNGIAPSLLTVRCWQSYLRKNNELISEVQRRQEEATKAPGSDASKETLRKCAELIKELNENLTQVGALALTARHCQWPRIIRTE